MELTDVSILWIPLLINGKSSENKLIVNFDVKPEDDGYLQEECFFHCVERNDKKYGFTIKKLTIGEGLETDVSISILDYDEFEKIRTLIKKHLNEWAEIL